MDDIFQQAYERWRKRHGSGFRVNDSNDKAAKEGYDEGEVEFLRAISAWRAVHHRLPTLLDGFEVALRLGYRKTEIQ